jgi:aspartyl protease family protein
MSNEDGPWNRHAPPPQRGGRRVAIWVAVLLLGTLAIWELSKAFPGSVSSGTDRAYLLFYVGWFALIARGIIFARDFKASVALRNIALWLGIVLILATAYTFRDEFMDIGVRLRSAFIPGYAVATSANEVVLSESEGGNYFVFGTVNGAPVKFLIDTGASDIVLSPDDARRVGIEVQSLDYVHTYETANGIGRGAAASVSSLAVGPINLTDVPVSINQAPMSSSLLGMTFLKRLKSFAFRNRRLYLRWR